MVPIPSLSNRVHLLHNLSTFTPPTAPLQYLGSQVDRPGVCSTRHVHHGWLCGLRRQLVAEDPRRSQSPDSHDGWCLPPFWQYEGSVRGSSVVLRLACLLRYQARGRRHACTPSVSCTEERKLRCAATEIVQEPGSSPDLLMMQDCTEQYALAISDDKLRALLADQPQNLAPIHLLPCCEVGRRSRMSPFTSGEKPSSAGGCVCSQHLPRLSESCASCPLLRQILRRLFVSPSVNDPPFSSISAANYGLSSLQNVTQLRRALRFVGREQSSSGTTVDSHPFFFGLHPFIALFAIEDVDPDSLCFSFLHNRLPGSPPVTRDRPCLHHRLVLSEASQH